MAASTIRLQLKAPPSADLLARLARACATCGGIAVSVNAEYALAAHVLRDGDEVGLLPPVSGGSPAPTADGTQAAASDSDQPVITALTLGVIDSERLIAEAGRAEEPER